MASPLVDTSESILESVEGISFVMIDDSQQKMDNISHQISTDDNLEQYVESNEIQKTETEIPRTNEVKVQRDFEGKQQQPIDTWINLAMCLSLLLLLATYQMYVKYMKADPSDEL